MLGCGCRDPGRGDLERILCRLSFLVVDNCSYRHNATCVGAGALQKWKIRVTVQATVRFKTRIFSIHNYMYNYLPYTTNINGWCVGYGFTFVSNLDDVSNFTCKLYCQICTATCARLPFHQTGDLSVTRELISIDPTLNSIQSLSPMHLRYVLLLVVYRLCRLAFCFCCKGWQYSC